MTTRSPNEAVLHTPTLGALVAASGYYYRPSHACQAWQAATKVLLTALPGQPAQYAEAGDWVVVTPDGLGGTYRVVLTDDQFQALYNPIVTPPEFMYSPTITAERP